MLRTSARDAAEVLNPPRTAEVVVVDPGLRMPRIAMHRCSHSMTTMTACAPSLSTSASAICDVNRSCTCGRLAYMSASRASFDRPVTCPLFPGM